MSEISRYSVIVLITALAVISGCTAVNKTNTTLDTGVVPPGDTHAVNSPGADVEITSIADVPDAMPDVPNVDKNNSRREPRAAPTVTPRTNIPSADTTVLPTATLPYITPPAPDAAVSPSVPTSTPAPTPNRACNELNIVRAQIQSLQNERVQKNQMVSQYQSLKSNATQYGDTESEASFQRQIDELKSRISFIEQQLNSLRVRESSLSGQCYGHVSS